MSQNNETNAYEVKGDSWYTWKGVKPPERQPMLKEDELEQVLQRQMQGHVCDWYQMGNSIYCNLGAARHGIIIGVDRRLAGTTPEGKPVLVPVGPILRKDVMGA